METATQTLHRLTSYGPYDEDTMWDPPVDDPRVVHDLVANDLDRLPWFFKRYDASLPRIELPRDLPTTTAGAVDVLGGAADVPPGELSLAQLGRLLFLCSGVVRTSQRRYGAHLFRASGSAGGRFPLEVYVAVPEGGELPGGVHWYHPQDHARVTVGPAPRGDVPAVVVTGIPWRTGWRYRERGFRHVYWDAGTMLSQLLAAADSAGVARRLFTRFPDEQVADLVGADGRHEWPVAVAGLGSGVPAVEPAGPAQRAAVDKEPLEFPLVTAAQHAGDGTELGPPWPAGERAVVPLSGGPPIDSVVLRRGSQRLMDPAGSLSREFLVTAMSVATRGVTVPHWVAVHRVADVAPGIYRWPDLDTAVRPGDVSDEVYRACLEQALGRDAAFVVFSTTDVGALDDRGYREAQLGAGIVEGRLHLAAYALGGAASGMTFADSLIPGLVGEPADGLLFTCVGVPEYAAKPGGLPGAPADVRMITPR